MNTTAAARMLVGESRRIVSFSGAGLSAESGVPTFRDVQTGALWAKYDPYQLASPEGFAADPKLVIEWYNFRRRAIAAAAPNPAHHALAIRKDTVHVTQNVDDLLERAGAESPPRGVMHLHGLIGVDRCHASCGYRESIVQADPPSLRNCPECGAYLRPAVVWFGEMLPIDVWRQAELACSQCDLLLVVGTSAEVYPAAGLIDVAKNGGAKVIVVNTNASAASERADIELIGPAGEIVPDIL